MYLVAVFPFVFYGCESWSLRVILKLQLFENEVLRKIFGPKRDDIKWAVCGYTY
jgi:hypothetical protein